YVGNNGTANISDTDSVKERTVSQGTGAYRDGATTPSSYSDYDGSYNSLNSFNQGSSASSWTVQAGETLQGIASQLWGDSNLWYKIAEINGLTGDESLVEGTILTIPAGVVRTSNSAQTFTPYDPNETLGSTAPTAAKPPKHHSSCGIAQVLLAVIAIAVVAFITPYATAFASNILGGATLAGGGAFTGVATAAAIASGDVVASTAAAVIGGAIGGAAGSIVSQAVGVATGIQDKFSWNAVALAAIGGGVGGGMGLKSPSGWGQAAANAAAQSIVTQGIGVATGLQDKFSWAAVAGAAVGAGIGFEVGKSLPGAAFTKTSDAGEVVHVGAQWYNTVAQSGASLIANAATRSVIDGSDFGDNVLAALPDTIGQTIGNAIAGGISGNGGDASTTGDHKSLLDEIGDGIHGLVNGVEHAASAVGDFLGFDGQFGYQGPVGRSESLAGLGNAIGNLIAPPAAAPVLAGYGGFGGISIQPLGNYDSSSGAAWTLTGGGAEETSRFGIGGNGPPPEFMSEQLFPNLPGAPIIGSIAAPLDSFVGLNMFGLMEDTNREVGGAQVGYLYGRLNDINVHPPQYSFNSFENMSWSERSGYVNYLQGYLAAGTLQLQRDTVSFLQESVDLRYNQALGEYRAGRLPAGLSQDQAVGSRMDVLMRGDLQAFYRSRDVSFGPRQYVTVNNRQYAADGSYRIPDAQVGRVWMDWTLSPKTASTPQVQGFNAARSNPIGGVIIRPTALGGSYWVAPLPPTRR
ncbi:MAG: LysM domain-containing protein, partial [Vitreimonas sp.]